MTRQDRKARRRCQFIRRLTEAKLSDFLFRKPKRLNIDKIRKSILYAQHGLGLSTTSHVEQIGAAERDRRLERVHRGIAGALLNSGGNRHIEIAIEHIGYALEAIVLLDYHHTSLNPPTDDCLGKDPRVFVDFCIIRRALYKQTWFNMCSINGCYEDIEVKRRMRRGAR